MMTRLKFCEKWIKGIRRWLGSATISILVNGSLIEEFRSTKRIRQGYLLAYFLFLIVAKRSVDIARQAKPKTYRDVRRCQNKRRWIQVNMLQYVDDILFICYSYVMIKPIIISF